MVDCPIEIIELFTISVDVITLRVRILDVISELPVSVDTTNERIIPFDTVSVDTANELITAVDVTRLDVVSTFPVSVENIVNPGILSDDTSNEDMVPFCASRVLHLPIPIFIVEAEIDET